MALPSGRLTSPVPAPRRRSACRWPARSRPAHAPTVPLARRHRDAHPHRRHLPARRRRGGSGGGHRRSTRSPAARTAIEPLPSPSAPRPGAHIRRGGQRHRAPATDCWSRARRLRPPPGAGRRRRTRHGLAVHRRPRVAVLATGDEFAAGRQPIGTAQIPDSNSVGLTAQARRAGAEVRSLRHRARRPGRGHPELREGSPGRTWSSSAAASRSARTTWSRTLSRGWASSSCGASPCSPANRWRSAGPDDGDRQVLLFGLPGNPVSSFVTFELFVRPVLRRLAGHADVIGREIVRARLSGAVSKPADRRTFLRVRLQDGQAPTGRWPGLARALRRSPPPMAGDHSGGCHRTAGRRGSRRPASGHGYRLVDGQTAVAAPERRRLTHVDRSGRPRMVDVSDKPPTARRAVAEAFVSARAGDAQPRSSMAA